MYKIPAAEIGIRGGDLFTLPMSIFTDLCYNRDVQIEKQAKKPCIIVLSRKVSVMQIGTFVHYSTKGICQVREIETMKFSSETKDYYVLVPVFDRNSKYYVPTDYDPQRIKIRSAIAPAMVEELMGYAKTCQPYEWVSNAHERKAKTEEILHSSDHKRILRLIKTLRCHEEHQKQIGKKMYLSDAKALRSALHIISDEFAFVRGEDPKTVAAYLETV